MPSATPVLQAIPRSATACVIFSRECSLAPEVSCRAASADRAHPGPHHLDPRAEFLHRRHHGLERPRFRIDVPGRRDQDRAMALRIPQPLPTPDSCCPCGRRARHDQVGRHHHGRCLGIRPRHHHDRPIRAPHHKHPRWYAASQAHPVLTPVQSQPVPLPPLSRQPPRPPSRASPPRRSRGPLSRHPPLSRSLVSRSQLCRQLCRGLLRDCHGAVRAGQPPPLRPWAGPASPAARDYLHPPTP